MRAASKVREGPRLEKLKHAGAEERLKASILDGGRDYPGKAEDLALVRRKVKERGARGVRRVVEGGA